MRRLKRLMAGLMAALLAASLAPAALASSGYDLLDILEEMYSEEQISFAPLLAATSEEDDSEDSEEQNETTAAPDTDYKHDSEGSAEITIGSVTEADGTAYVPIYVTASSGLNGVQMSVTYGDGLTYLSAESSKDFSWASVEEGSGKLSFMFANAQNVTTSASNLLLTTLEFAVDTDTYNPGTVISVSGSCDYVTYREDDEEANVIYTVIYDTVEISSGSVTVHTPAETPAIGTQPEAEAYYGQNSEASALTVTASVSDGGTLSYQWYSNSTNSTEGGTAIDGATNASYTPSTEQTGITYYYCTVVNTLNGVPSVAVTSDIAAVTVFTITVDPSSAEVNVGSRVPLSFSVSTITADTAEWSSSDEAVATVTSAGMVTGVSAGTATITATVYGVSATAEVTVNAVAVESIALNAETLSLTVGDNSTLTATVSPSNATDSTVTWTSSDASVATVDENG
ncbi:MAG: Ig-like domain-containing protein, partial [Oscillospiraceae bacterium]|nr:Ig-like domain-containing protein [Oscillospiraceae bacterium]